VSFRFRNFHPPLRFARTANSGKGRSDHGFRLNGFELEIYMTVILHLPVYHCQKSGRVRNAGIGGARSVRANVSRREWRGNPRGLPGGTREARFPARSAGNPPELHENFCKCKVTAYMTALTIKCDSSYYLDFAIWRVNLWIKNSWIKWKNPLQI
jgi:hypothetical protein